MKWYANLKNSMLTHENNKLTHEMGATTYNEPLLFFSVHDTITILLLKKCFKCGARM